MFVYLLRHGNAADQAPDGSMDDSRRELTADGMDKLASACQSYARIMVPPQRIWHSPLIRARQSAEILAKACDVPQPLEEHPLLRPGGQVAAMVDVLQGELLAGLESTLLVGHEPNLGNLLGLLVSGTERLSIPLGKGMLAGVKLETPQVMTGRLQVLLNQGSGAHLL